MKWAKCPAQVSCRSQSKLSDPSAQVTFTSDPTCAPNFPSDTNVCLQCHKMTYAKCLRRLTPVDVTQVSRGRHPESECLFRPPCIKSTCCELCESCKRAVLGWAGLQALKAQALGRGGLQEPTAGVVLLRGTEGLGQV